MPTVSGMKRKRLFREQAGLCWYCRLPMALVRFPKNMKKGDPIDSRACTLEHLVDRFDPMRRAPAKNERRHVAACYGFNQRRSVERQNEMRRMSQFSCEQAPTP